MADFAHLDHNVSTWPPWGSLAIDSFMIDNWDTSSDKSDEDQRLALVREFVKVGRRGRQQHARKVAKGTVKPTDDQVGTILQPLRSPVLRYVATKLDGEIRDYNRLRLWLRTDYADEERHKTFCQSILDSDSVDCGEALYEDSTILSNSYFYNFSSWREALDTLPELVAGAECKVEEDTDGGIDYRREKEREYMDHQGEPVSGDISLAAQQDCCAVCYLIVEDQELYATDPPLFHALWLDDCGNIVRENRITTGQASIYPSMAREGMGAENEIWMEAKIGPKYEEGAEFGPPFSV
ncbi:hypothetical protein B0A50_01185 [Salinomyces thailandicus]|uniref:Uncharacterized protein n=1 Tax=Salinomyces thailandicus TaxID=706561 RepID=A0A4V5N888_9PEZI|nr:hypothetical protein B0A50_01185 [Salinomyces thailandica]